MPISLPSPASPEARSLARALSISTTLADVLLGRGHSDLERTKRFLAPKLAHLTAPDAMIGRDGAAERLAFAVKNGERVVVFGDYDCDGITSASLLTEALRTLGGEVVPLLASRFAGGYGFSQPALERALAASPRVLVTCDCGSSDHPRIAAARAAGVDVIVIDHHLVPSEPLDALAFLNPHRPECGFPYKGLASVGLALSVAAAVRQKLGVALDLRRYLDLVAIGTIADVAPLDGDNRALVRAGLASLQLGGRPGIRALAEQAKLDLGAPLSAEDVSFRLAPRLNAPGRMGSPDAAMAVLLARDLGEARSAAAACEQANIARKELQARMIDEAMAMIAEGKLDGRDGLALAREGWHPGVVGIVAGRIASALGRPVIVGAIENGVVTASVRSGNGVPVVTALGRCRELVRGFGGHEKAAGVSFDASRLGELAEGFDAACRALALGAPTAAETRADVRLDEDDDPFNVLNDFSQLEPCGEGNRAPSLGVAARVRSAREVKGGHLKLDLELRGRIVSGFGAGLGGLAKTLDGDVHLVGSLRRDTWRGGIAVELRVDAIEKT